MNNNELNKYILTVDDNPDQVSISHEFLVRRGFDVDMETDPEKALESIDNTPYKGIVSDYDMPKIDGLELLEEVRSLKPEIPFILYTGRGSEEVASEAIAKGVTDYVQKNEGLEDFDRIAETLEKEIQNDKTTIFEKTLNEEEISSDIIEESIKETRHSIMITDRSGRIQYVNEAVLETSGYKRDELIGERPNIFQSGEHPDRFYNNLWDTIKNGEVWEGQLLNESKEGERYKISQTITPVEFGGETYFVAINKTI